MALIDGTVDATLDYIGVRANDAQEMLAKLTEAVAAIQAGVIIDLELKGCGAGPKFMATLAISDGSEGGASPVVDPGDAAFIVVGGSGGIDPIALAAQMNAEIVNVGQVPVHKCLMACGGAGPNWMGITLYAD